MLKKHKLFTILSGIVIVYALFIGFSQNSQAQCTYCSASTSVQDEYIGRVKFAGIDNPTSGNNGFSNTVANFTNHIAYVKPGQTYTMEVWNGGNAYSSDNVAAFFDWNNDCDFDDPNERFSIAQSGTPAGAYFKQDITIPTGITSGSKRMRVRMMWAATVVACGSSSYGEVEDYTVIVQGAPDAAVENIIVPTYPYPEGTYNVSMVLGNRDDGALGSCTINWSVNGVNRTPVNWSGNLAKGNTVQILLGSFPFVYPDGGPFTPFVITVWLTNIVGVGTSDPDSDPSNNTRTINTAPATEDAQPVAIVGPSGSFTPGLRDVVVRIRNNARKPLSVVDIEWFVDGVKRGTRKWFGTLTQNQTADVVVGQFDFQFKAPLAPYEIKVTTLNPNGIADPFPANDNLTEFRAPSLVAGTYTIGGSTAHFPTFSSAAQYLSSSGIIGPGPVVFNINSGTYTEQVTINDFANNNNTFTFQSATGFASDVRLNVTTNTNPWAVGINGLDNVTLRNLTINVTRGTASGANAIWTSNSENLVIENVVLTGPSNPTRTQDFALIFIDNSIRAIVRNSTLNGGSHGIYTNNSSTPNFTFTGLKFNNFNGYGIFQNLTSGGLAQPKDKQDNYIQSALPLTIENNEFTGTTQPGTGGLWLQSSARIVNNTFVNYNSTTVGNAVIMLNAPTSLGSLIENNTISNATGVSGIVVNSGNTKINKNSISLATGNITVSGLSVRGTNNSANYNRVVISGNTTSSGMLIQMATNGIFANNLVNATGPIAINVQSNTMPGIYYNTFATNSTATAANFSGGSSDFRRNLIVNLGTGRSVATSVAAIISANNNFFTKGTTNTSDLTNWLNATGDATTSNTNIQLTDDGTYQFVQFVESAVTYTPLGIGDEFELYDYNGLKRDGFYYIGYAGIELEISILKQPRPIMACNGETNRQIDLAAAISYGATAQYQWFKDGIPIPGATNPVLRFPTFTYETSGNYKCRIYGPANTAQGIFSNEILVYTLRPTEITKQPTVVKGKMGGTVFFEIEAHTKGITPPLFQHRYQWYRRFNGQDIQLIDNENYAGTRSPIMTVTKLVDKHFSGSTDDYYFIEVEGQCGTVRSKPIKLEMEASDVVIDAQPKDASVCLAGIAKFTGEAQVPGSNEAIQYQWFKDDAALADNARITGAKTNTLTIANVTLEDAGKYHFVAKAPISGTEKTSNKANLTVNILPVFDAHPKDVTVKETETITLTVEVSGTEPFTYQWYKDDKKIDGAIASTYTIQSAALEHSGLYTCEASNVCGKTKSNPAIVVVEKKGGVTSVTDNDAFNMQVTPNPIKNDVNISFEMENEGAIEIAILDVTGRTVHNLSVNGVSGLNNVSFDITNKVSSGTYFVKIQNGQKTSIKQIVIAR